MATWTELTAMVEHSVNKTLDQCYPDNWNEDFITRSIIVGIRNTISTHAYFRGTSTFRVDMQLYKQTGTPEKLLGDLALLVNLAHKGEKMISGAAYLEAKRREMKSVAFPAMNSVQAKRILKNAPQAYYLLYDYDYTTRFVAPVGYTPWIHHEPPLYHHVVASQPAVRALTLPINTALASGLQNISLYHYANPFSHQLMGRYLCGFDLDYSVATISMVTGHRTKMGLPKRVVVINVTEGDIRSDIGIQMNLDLFEKDGEG